MKQLITLVLLMCVCLVLKAAPVVNATEEVQKSQSENCRVTKKSAGEASGSISFEIEVAESGLYSLDLWQCAARKADGSLQSYTISVGDGTQMIKAVPETAGWYALRSSAPVNLVKGKNKITVASDLPCVPNIEFVEAVKNSQKTLSRMRASTRYNDYISSFSSTRRAAIGIIPPPLETDTLFSLDATTVDQPPYAFKYHRIPWFGYSFYTTAYFKQGQTISVSSVGQNGLKHFVEVFSMDSPNKYSWIKLSDEKGNASLSINITATGTYYVMLRTFNNGSRGFCDLNVNNQMNYESVPVCSMGVHSPFVDESAVYNIFTANAESDPFIFLMSGDSYGGKVYAFNDNYASSGDFDWGRNARITRNFTVFPKLENVVVTSAGSFNPLGSCDLYVGCKGSPITSFFENLKPDDAIASAPASYRYNCISWSGGIHSYWEWPASYASPYYTGDALESFDLFYTSERYPGCAVYTRGAVNSTKPGVDLWGLNLGDAVEYTHGSVSINTDGNHHGYSWESKPGALTRTFHPRKALEGMAYGEVLHHYNLNTAKSKPSFCLEEAIADGKAVMENVKLTTAQESYIDSKIASISTAVKNNFNTLYTAWKNIWQTTIYSNPSQIKDCDAYSNLLSACETNGNLVYMIYDKVNKGDQSALPLFEELVIVRNESNKMRMNSIHLSNNNKPYDASGRKIVRTINSNMKLLLKQILSSVQYQPGQNDTAETNDIIDQSEGFRVKADGGMLDITLTIPRESMVSIDVLDLNGNVVEVIKTGSILASGIYDYASNVKKIGNISGKV